MRDLFFVALPFGVIAAHLLIAWLIVRRFSAPMSYLALLIVSFGTFGVWFFISFMVLFGVYENPDATGTERAVADFIFGPTMWLVGPDSIFQGTWGFFATILTWLFIFFLLGLLPKVFIKRKA
ncbi:MAG TPA: hypothetical protein VJ183_14965 [Chloroflexia bacterium]|nr:hypothetical protein [Chloroflexia bacterium]